MGQIDVTELLQDPEFVDPVVLIHRSPVINAYGENVLSENGVQTVGSVQPISGKTLQRLPEALRVASVMSFWVKGKIVSDGRCQYPDLISYRGQRYAVQAIFDWTNWGAGYSEGTCVRELPTQ
jgi:galactose-6-phosphate isomerase